MRDHFGRTVGICIVGLGLLAFVISAPAGSREGAKVSAAQYQQGQNPQTPSDQMNQANPETDQGAMPAEEPASAASVDASSETRPGISADAVLGRWPDAPQRVARRMIDKYGQPDEVTPSMLVWNNNGPWKRTVVFREEVPHNFPRKHVDVLQQFISYHVPLNKLDDLARFDGSLLADRTKGELSSRSDREETNILALNLANDIITGNKGVDDARAFFGKTESLSMSGKSSPYTERLLFHVYKSGTADPDRSVIQTAIAPGTTAPARP